MAAEGEMFEWGGGERGAECSVTAREPGLRAVQLRACGAGAPHGSDE